MAFLMGPWHCIIVTRTWTFLLLKMENMACSSEDDAFPEPRVDRLHHRETCTSSVRKKYRISATTWHVTCNAG